jgi:propanol-preferring alcohol dehydrogenase
LTATQMTAARYHGPGQLLRIESVPIPSPARGEALIRVRAAGVCHTELHLLDGVLNLGVSPLTPGHEVVGDIVDARGPCPVAIGQRVLLSYYIPCGACSYCRGGFENLCPNVARQIGFSADGGYAEYVVAPFRCLVPLPPNLSDDEAVGLACGGATALHAARAIAGVALGETVVVYGVGGVGLYLIQVCQLAGARVVAIGRSATKLALARDVGADICVNASEGDPIGAVLNATQGQGAEVVFDLVASAETMRNAPRLLARRGRLVFAGYGADQLELNPLHLVLQEIQILGALGNTLSELVETVALAAAGRLRSVVGQIYPLASVNDALDDLRAGKILGRAVLHPAGFGPGSGEVAVARDVDLVDGLNGNASPSTERVELTATARPKSAPAKPPKQRRERALATAIVQRPGTRPFEAELLDLIGAGVNANSDDEQFDALARGLFAYQYRNNEPYRQFCDLRQVAPDILDHWTEIPAVPIGAFKVTNLCCEPIDHAVALFMSSGTTQPEQRSRHYHPDLRVYDASTTTNFAAHFLPEMRPGECPFPMLVLNPRPGELPNSSLAYYLGLMLDRYGSPESEYFVDERGLARDRLLKALRQNNELDRPVALLGTTFGFVHFLDWLEAEGMSVALPPGSRVFDTGGVKGRSRDISRDELDAAIATRLGVGVQHQVNMYGLTELSTQFIDQSLRSFAAGMPLNRAKSVPPWARTRVLDPETLAELPPGEVGVLCHTDLANRASVCTVLTEDLGVARPGGFEVLGRISGSEARGCSIAMDELLAATGHPA